MRTRLIVSPALLAAVSACSSSSSSGNSAITLSAVSGDHQAQLINTQLPLPLVVGVDGSARTAAYGKTVNWTILSGGGSLSATTSTIDYSGHSAVLFTLGPAYGTQSARAALADGTGAFTFTATATGNAFTLAPESGGGQSGTALATLPVPLVVLVKDSTGAAAGGRTVTWSVVRGLGFVSPTTSVTDAAGHASTQFTLGPVVGSQSAQASVAGAAVRAAASSLRPRRQSRTLTPPPRPARPRARSAAARPAPSSLPKSAPRRAPGRGSPHRLALVPGRAAWGAGC